MDYISIVLKGFSHIFFQENILFGALIVLGLGIASPVALLLSLIGNIAGLVISIVLGVKKPIVELGIFGFNGVLIGSMVTFYVKQLPQAIILTIIASVIGGVLFYLFFRNNIPPFAAPFVIVAWAILLLIKIVRL